LRITLNRFTSGLLLVLLTPIVLPIKLLNAVTRRGKTPAYASTIAGDPLTYSGDRPVLIAIWASWAGVWRGATEQVVEQLRGEFAGRCEFGYVECNSSIVKDTYRADVVPVLILRHRGQELARFVNALEAEKVRQAIAEVAA
jgi:thioredoxin-like negative regulator of GroEL